MDATRTISHRLFADEAGLAAIEYALLAALIALAMLGGLTQLGSTTTAMWSTIATSVAGG